MRFGNYFLIPKTDSNHDAMASALKEALEADPRVLTVTTPESDPEYERRFGMSRIYPPIPSDEEENRDKILTGSDSEQHMQYLDAFTLTIHVPTKNQPAVGPDREPLAEDYVVKWDGSTLAIAWEQSQSQYVRMAGGQIIIQILEQALAKCAGGLIVQPCSPGCEHGFLHESVRVSRVGDSKARELQRGSYEHELVIRVPKDESIGSIADDLFWRTRTVLASYGNVKNLGHRLLAVGLIADTQSIKLLTLHYDRVSFGDHPHPWIHRWMHRTWRKEAKIALARVWLALSTLAFLRRIWSRNRLQLERDADSESLKLLFEDDLLDDVRAIESIEPAAAIASMKQFESRMTSRALAIATALGGFAGGVAGFAAAVLSK